MALSIQATAFRWRAFAPLAVTYALVTLVAPDTPVARAVLGFAYLSYALLAVMAVVQTTATMTGIERRAWISLSSAAGLIFAGDLLWIAGEIGTGRHAAYSGSGTIVLYAAAYVPLVVYTIILLSAGLAGAPVLTKIRYVLDLSIAALMVGAALGFFVLLPSHRAASPSDAYDWLIYSSTLLASACMFVALLAAVIESRDRVWGRWETKVAAAVGLIMLAGAVTVSTRLYSGEPLLQNADLVVDMLWLGAYFCLGAAAAQRLDHGPDSLALPSTAHAQRARVRWYDLVLAALLALTLPYAIVASYYGQLDESEFWLVIGGASLTAILVVSRSIVMTSENGSLLSHTVVDPLTGVFNHRYFHERVVAEMEKARRDDKPLSILLLDIDGFARMNDKRGHSAGDRFLRRVAEAVLAVEGPGDTVCRMGGDEFGMILRGATLDEAEARAQRLQKTLSDRVFDGTCIESASIGIAGYPDHASDHISLVAKADGALYWAQATGPGHVVVYDDEVVQALDPEERLRIAQEQSYMQTVESLALAVDARDPYTQFHSRNVSRLAGRLAHRTGLAPNRVALIEIAGLLHDVGKIGVPDSILRKPGMLTARERLKIEEHPDLGQRILAATIFKEILPWVRSHHECWDGSGYPEGLRGEEIPYEARLLSVCDAFDAMVSDRPYRKGIALEVAIEEILAHAGTQFDPEIAEAFVGLVRGDETLLRSAPFDDVEAPALSPLLDLS